MASGAYQTGVNAIVTQSLNLTSSTIKAALMLSSYTYNPDQDNMSDISASEASGATRQTLANDAWAVDDTNNRVYYDADNITFSAVTTGQTVAGVAIHYASGADATSTLICYNEFSGTIATNGGDITVTFDSTGILRLQD